MLAQASITDLIAVARGIAYAWSQAKAIDMSEGVCRRSFADDTIGSISGEAVASFVIKPKLDPISSTYLRVQSDTVVNNYAISALADRAESPHV